MARKYRDGFHLGDKLVMPKSGKILGPNGDVSIQPRLMDVLLCLAEHEGDIVDRETLVTTVWGHTAVTDDSVNKSISKIRSLLGDDPKNPHFVETLPKRGYRLVTTITPIEREDAADDGEAIHGSHVPAGRFSMRVVLAAVSTLAVAATIGVTMLLRIVPDDAAIAFEPPEKSIAVLPFQDLGADSAYDYFGDGLAEDLQISLSRIDDLLVVARSSSVAASQDFDDARAIGQQLNVSSVLEGSVRFEGQRVRVTANLINTRNGIQLWSQSFDREVADIIAVQDSIASSVSRSLEVKFRDDDPALLIGNSNPTFDAYNLYLLGRSYLHKRTAGSLELATEHFRQSTRLDPEYALAFSGLVTSYVFQTLYSNMAIADARALAKPALAAALDHGSDLAEAQLAKALYYSYLDNDTAKSLAAYSLANEIDPNNVQVLRALANIAMNRSNLAEATNLLGRAGLIDPLNQAVATTRINLLMRAGRYDSARNLIDTATWAAQAEPNLLRVVAAWIGAYGSPVEAMSWAERAREKDPNGVLTQLAFVQLYLQTGNLERANAHLSLAEDAAPNNLSNFVWRAKLLAAKREIAGLRRFTEASMERNRPEQADDFSYAWFWALYYNGFAALLDDDYETAIRDLELVTGFDTVFDLVYLELQTLLASAYAKSGQPQLAEQMLLLASENLKMAKADGWGKPQLDYIEASILALQGDQDAAIDTLEEALAAGPTTGIKGSLKGHWSLPFDPTLDSLRSNERFIELLRDGV